MVKKKAKKKNKKKFSLKEIFKGFTLVELLAVIVILGIIMVIAIPSVLNTLEISKKKTFLEYVQKIYSTAHTKWLQETSMDGGLYEGEGMYVFNIRTDLGLSSTGSYGGYVLVNSFESDGDIRDDFYMYIWDDDYFIGFTPTYEGIPNNIDVKVGEYSDYHPWNKSGASYVLNRKEVESTYFNGIDFNSFVDQYVACFIQHYWIPWNGQGPDEVNIIYFVDGYPSKKRTSISYPTPEKRAEALATCILNGES